MSLQEPPMLEDLSLRNLVPCLTSSSCGQDLAIQPEISPIGLGVRLHSRSLMLKSSLSSLPISASVSPQQMCWSLSGWSFSSGGSRCNVGRLLECFLALSSCGSHGGRHACPCLIQLVLLLSNLQWLSRNKKINICSQDYINSSLIPF